MMISKKKKKRNFLADFDDFFPMHVDLNFKDIYKKKLPLLYRIFLYIQVYCNHHLYIILWSENYFFIIYDEFKINQNWL